MSKGRRTPPPPFKPITPANPTLEEMLAAITGRSGLFMVSYEHDRGCPTVKTQRMEHCTCKQVDHRLLAYDEGQVAR
jgi:hypothetical protein